MEIYLQILKKCPLFFDIEESDLITMLGCLGAKVEHFDKKYTVMSEGSSAKYVGIMLSGSAQISATDYYGNRSIIGSITPSELFGEAFACSGTEALPVSVIANEPCEIMFIECAHILNTCCNACSFHSRLIFNLMKDLAQKTLIFHKKIDIISKRTTRDKLMAYLMSEAKKNASNTFVIPYDRQELADYLEVERSGLSSEISKLQKEGVLITKKNHFKLL